MYPKISVKHRKANGVQFKQKTLPFYFFYSRVAKRTPPPPLFKPKDLIDYLGIWFIFTVFLSSLPLLFKVLAYIILSKTIILTESITEILFLSILLSTDSIRVVQISRNKKAINSILLFLDIPSVILSMIFYGFFAYAQYANIRISVPNQELLLLALVISALLFDISAQVVYIVQGNLSFPVDSDVQGFKSDKESAKPETSAAKPELSDVKPEEPTTEPEEPNDESIVSIDESPRNN